MDGNIGRTSERNECIWCESGIRMAQTGVHDIFFVIAASRYCRSKLIPAANKTFAQTNNSYGTTAPFAISIFASFVIIRFNFMSSCVLNSLRVCVCVCLIESRLPIDVPDLSSESYLIWNVNEASNLRKRSALNCLRQPEFTLMPCNWLVAKHEPSQFWFH